MKYTVVNGVRIPAHMHMHVPLQLLLARLSGIANRVSSSDEQGTKYAYL